MINLKNKLIILLLISNVALANVANANDIQLITKGTPAPYDGFLMDNEKALSIRNQELDLGLANKKLDINTQINTLLQDSLNKSNQQVNNLNTELLNVQSSTKWENAVFFVAGALITGTIAYGIYKTR